MDSGFNGSQLSLEALAWSTGLWADPARAISERSRAVTESPRSTSPPLEGNVTPTPAWCQNHGLTGQARPRALSRMQKRVGAKDVSRGTGFLELG